MHKLIKTLLALGTVVCLLLAAIDIYERGEYLATDLGILAFMTILAAAVLDAFQRGTDE